jgi:hypothetical protein
MWERFNDVLNRSADRIVTGLANLLPGLLALIVIVLLAMLAGWIVRGMLRRSLETVHFDRRLDQWGFSGLGDWSPRRSPTLLISQLVFWLVILFGILLGLSALDQSLASQLAARLFDYLPNVLAAALVVAVGSLIARFLARAVLISAVNMQIQSARLLSLGVKWMVTVLTAAMALEHLGIGGQIVRLAFAILFGGIVLALALAVGLGSKDMVSRSLERQVERSEEETEEQFHHL